MFRPALWNRKNDVASYTDPFDMMDLMFQDFWGTGLQSTSGMKTDVLDEGDHYQLEAELPGFNKEDINVDLKDDVLTVSATHSEESDDKDKKGNYVRRERRYASYQRSFRVDGLKTEDIDAEYKNGVLMVRIPKKDAVPAQEVQKIEVKG